MAKSLQFYLDFIEETEKKLPLLQRLTGCPAESMACSGSFPQFVNR